MGLIFSLPLGYNSISIIIMRIYIIIQVSGKLTRAEDYAKRRGGSVLTKTGKINGYDVFLWSCENELHQWEAPYSVNLSGVPAITQKENDQQDIFSKIYWIRNFRQVRQNS